MEIWIRSQDREHLVLATDIDIDYSDKSMIMINNYYMAKYKTPERALEILDEITQMMNINTAITGTNDDMDIQIKALYLSKSRLLYIMPKE